MLSDDEIKLLNERQLAQVATVMPDGSPQLTAVWVDTDGDAVIFNTAKGRVKHRNILRDPRIAVLVADKDDFYRTFSARGRAELVEEGADEHIDALARKYLGADTYPFRSPDEERVIVRLVPGT